MPVEIKQDGVAKMRKAIAAFTSKELLIGIPASTMERTDGSITNATIGYLNEKGSPAQNIPPRPHLVPGVEKAAPEAIRHLKIGAAAALHGDISKIDDEFTAAGMVCVTAVKLMITSVLPPPLKSATIKTRQRKGHTGESPLIDTGAYLNAITFVVRDKK
jgi:hypothetical protein